MLPICSAHNSNTTDTAQSMNVDSSCCTDRNPTVYLHSDVVWPRFSGPVLDTCASSAGGRCDLKLVDS